MDAGKGDSITCSPGLSRLCPARTRPSVTPEVPARDEKADECKEPCHRTDDDERRDSGGRDETVRDAEHRQQRNGEDPEADPLQPIQLEIGYRALCALSTDIGAPSTRHRYVRGWERLTQPESTE